MTYALKPPKTVNALKRKRLFRLIDRNLYRRNILILGQAAQGKSTLVASYLENSPNPVLWAALSAQDSSHSLLFEKLAGGLAAVGAVSGSSQDLLIPRSTLGAREKGLRHIEALTALLQSMTKPVTIVFDDLQLVAEDSSGFMMVRQMLDLSMPMMNLLLLSRQMPNIDAARLKMHQQLYIVENEHLAFTLEETKQLIAGIDPAADIDFEEIHRITEGWAGGLTLVSESIRRFSNRPKLPDKLSADVFNFFSQEIYNRLEAPVKQFLITVSVLDLIHLEAVSHLLETNTAKAFLRDLEKRNLFVQQIDDDIYGSTYRFHDLFRNFLLKSLRREKGDDAVNQLNRKAGQYFWNQNDHEQAMTYFIRAQSIEDMIRIIKIKGKDYIIRGEMGVPEKWLSRLPRELIVNDPWLLFYATMTRRIKGGKKNITRLNRALTLFEQTGDIRGMLLATGFLIEAAVFIRQPSNRIRDWIENGEYLLLQVGSSSRYPWARTLLWQQIGLGYIAGDGNIPKGISACQNAILLGRQIKNPELIVNACVTMTFGHVQAGDFSKARQILLDISELTQAELHPEYRALKTLGDIELALKNADFDLARDLLNRSEKDIERFGLIFLYPGFIEEKAYYMIYTGRFEDALQLADHLNDFSILEGNNFYSGISNRIKALSYLKQGNPEKALTYITPAIEQLDKTRKGEIHHFIARQIEGLIFYQAKKYASARKSLLNALDYFKAIGSDLCFSETAVALGLVCLETRGHPDAFKFLKQGFEKIDRKKYLFFPLLTDRMISKAIVALTYQDKMLPTARQHFLELVSRCESGPVAREIQKALALSKKTRRADTREALRPIYKQLLPQMHIRSLGEFAIFLGDQRVDPSIFQGTKPVLLLKSIVLHDGRDIPKEILIDDLWPEADYAAGEKNFKINLHRLRKGIEPGPAKEFGYSYIMQRAGLISLDPDLVRLDSQQFMDLSRKGAQMQKQNRLKTALDFYNRAADLYQGEYFAETPYVEWIHRKRDLYRSRYFETMKEKARLHEELDQIGPAIETWKSVLLEDSLFETAYQNLMILYADSGRKNKAIQTFRDCQTVLEKNLGIPPSRQTLQIYEKICSG